MVSREVTEVGRRRRGSRRTYSPQLLRSAPQCLLTRDCICKNSPNVNVVALYHACRRAKTHRRDHGGYKIRGRAFYVFPLSFITSHSVSIEVELDYAESSIPLFMPRPPGKSLCSQLGCFGGVFPFYIQIKYQDLVAQITQVSGPLRLAKVLWDRMLGSNRHMSCSGKYLF